MVPILKLKLINLCKGLICPGDSQKLQLSTATKTSYACTLLRNLQQTANNNAVTKFFNFGRQKKNTPIQLVL
jgi:hypothetical protein